MPAKVKPRRKYNSPLRSDQARQTRARILEAARELFSERGYAGTTITAVAERAVVSPETIYLTLESKRGLLEGVIEIAIAPEARAVQEEALRAELAQLADPRDRLDTIIEYSCSILARTRPIHAVIRGAADGEPFAAALGRRLLRDRLANQTERIRRHLAEHLRGGLSVSEAGQRYCALTSPDLYHLLTVELGWTTNKHRDWLSELLAIELLEDPGS